MKKLHEETKRVKFMLAPSNEKRTKVIKKMKSSSSTCPFDQISVLALKRCPILQTTLPRIMSHC